jgi:hypothetical protein
MDLRAADDSESRFAGYIEGLVSVIGHADRAGPLRDYCVGLMLPCERKSVEPIAAVTAPERRLRKTNESPVTRTSASRRLRETKQSGQSKSGPIVRTVKAVDDFAHEERHVERPNNMGFCSADRCNNFGLDVDAGLGTRRDYLDSVRVRR